MSSTPEGRICQSSHPNSKPAFDRPSSTFRLFPSRLRAFVVKIPLLFYSPHTFSLNRFEVSYRPMAIPTIEPGRPLKLAVLISGSGSTLLNIQQRIQAGTLNAQVVQVISSKPGTLGVERANTLGLPLQIISRKDFSDTQAYSNANLDAVRKSEADLVCLAGFLQFLTIPADFEDRVINIHPSLLPSFGGQGMYGHHVHEAVIKAGCKVSGCTVHFADNQFDHGPILLQRTCPVLHDDTPETLAKRVYAQECEAYPEALQAIASGRAFKRPDGTCAIRVS